MDFKLDTFLVKLNSKNIISISQKPNEYDLSEEFVLHDIGVSSRIFNNWVKVGLMPTRARTDMSDHRFNFIELIWFNLVMELRVFGFSLKKIKIVGNLLLGKINLTAILRSLDKDKKAKIIQPVKSINAESEEEKTRIIQDTKRDLRNIERSKEPIYFNWLEGLIKSFLIYRTDVKIMIDPSGKVALDFGDTDKSIIEAQMKEDGFDSESYIVISLMKFFKKFISEQKHINYIKRKKILNENEIFILNQIREGRTKEIILKFTDKKPTILEVAKGKNEDIESQISELMLSRKYQEISVITEDGIIAVSAIKTKLT
jgi:hypothetical protein